MSGALIGPVAVLTRCGRYAGLRVRGYARGSTCASPASLLRRGFLHETVKARPYTFARGAWPSGLVLRGADSVRLVHQMGAPGMTRSRWDVAKEMGVTVARQPRALMRPHADLTIGMMIAAPGAASAAL